MNLCGPFGVKEDMKGITMYCTGCKYLNFSKEKGFSCGWDWSIYDSSKQKEIYK